MRVFLTLILLLLLASPGMAQQLQGSVNNARELNNNGLDAIGRKDYDGAERQLRQAYDLSLQAKDTPRVKTTLGNLSALYQITGKADQKGRIDAMLHQINMPIIDQPCGTCMDHMVNTQQANRVELMGLQNGFDRQTFREDQAFQMGFQNQNLQFQQRMQQDSQVRAHEQAQMQDYTRNNQLLQQSNPSYMSRYNH